MSRFFKTSLVMLLSSVLFYYGVAWAVLRCSHDQENTDQEIAMVSGRADSLNLECVCPDYHTETMVGTSSLSQQQKLASDLARHITDLLTLRAPSGNETNDAWLRAVSDRIPSLAFLIGVSRYLSLSILRI